MRISLDYRAVLWGCKNYLKLPLLIEAYRAVAQVEEACRVLAEALALVDKHREHFWEAELHRLKGHLLVLGPFW